MGIVLGVLAAGALVRYGYETLTVATVVAALAAAPVLAAGPVEWGTGPENGPRAASVAHFRLLDDALPPARTCGLP